MGQYMLLLFLAICKKIKKKWLHLKFFLTQDQRPYILAILPYGAPTIFMEPIQTFWEHGYDGKSKCLLEYCNEKLASIT